MRARWQVLTFVAVAAFGYVAYPYVTLFRLGLAVQTADATTLERLVDWYSVREGIKEDVSDLPDDGAAAAPAGKLPEFGASFVRGITSNVIDRQINPQAIVAASTGLPGEPAPAANMAKMRIGWAFFESPTVFTVDLRASNLSEPIRMEMDLSRGTWQVRRVWLPDELLKGPPART
jgi:Protein of unknown function (DUF2939)